MTERVVPLPVRFAAVDPTRVSLNGVDGVRSLRLPFQRRHARLDWLGAGFQPVGIASSMIALEEGQ